MKTNNLIKLSFLWLIYYLILLLVNGSSIAQAFLSQSDISSIEEKHYILLMLELFVPCVAFFVLGIKKQGFVVYINNIVRFFVKHKVAYTIFLFILLILQWNFVEGVYYIDGKLFGIAINLEPSVSSYIILFVCHYIFAEVITIIYLMLMPLITKVAMHTK